MGNRTQDPLLGGLQSLSTQVSQAWGLIPGSEGGEQELFSCEAEGIPGWQVIPVSLEVVETQNLQLPLNPYWSLPILIHYPSFGGTFKFYSCQTIEPKPSEYFNSTSIAFSGHTESFHSLSWTLLRAWGQQRQTITFSMDKQGPVVDQRELYASLLG